MVSVGHMTRRDAKDKSGGGGAGERVVIASLEEFCAIPGVPSFPTVRKLIQNNPDFPAKAGTNGKAYQIDVAKGIAWLQAQEESRVEEQRRHAEEVKQFGLELLGDGAATDLQQVGLTADERKKLLEEEFFAIKVREKRGELIRRAEIEAAASDVIVTDARRRSTFMSRLAKRVELTREQIAAGEALMDMDRKAFASDIERLAETDHVDAASGAVT